VDHLLNCNTLVILDVEMTAWEGSCARGWSEPWEEREIIQIGMLAVEAATLKPLGHFSCLIKPKINPKLSPYIIALTGLTQQMIDSDGLSLEEAFKKSTKFVSGLKQTFKIISNGPDGLYLFDNAVFEQVECPEFFKKGISIRSYLKKNISSYTDEYFSCDLVDLVGGSIEGQKHSALYDVQSIAEALRYIKASPAV